MSAKVGYSTPMLHVAEIEKSIRFYELLGFTTIDTEGCTPLAWARLHCEDGSAVMFLRAEHPVDASAQALLLYMYTPDLAGLRERLLASGVKVPPINHPEYMPSGKINIADPDGYRIEIGHWGKSEQESWEKRISAKVGGPS
jgi:catechol 2,3-dioxygenase-like lactoylglutathione lyase family enzyme